MKTGCPHCEHAFALMSMAGWDMSKVQIGHPEHEAKPADLKIYTIYDHPKDHPNHYVLRGFTIMGPTPVPDKEPLLFQTLELARQLMEGAGKTCLPRQPGDDPVILESWV